MEMIHLLVVVALVIQLAHCSCNGPQVLSAPVQNVTVLDPNLRRGLTLSVGTPP